MNTYDPIRYSLNELYATQEILVRLHRTSLSSLTFAGLPAGFSDLISADVSKRLAGLESVCPLFLEAVDLLGAPASILAGLDEYLDGAPLRRAVNGALASSAVHSEAQTVNLLTNYRLRFATAESATAALEVLAARAEVAVAERAPRRYIMVQAPRGTPAKPKERIAKNAEFLPGAAEPFTSEELGQRFEALVANAKLVPANFGTASITSLVAQIRNSIADLTTAVKDSRCCDEKPNVPDPAFQDWPFVALETSFDKNRGEGVTLAMFDLGVQLNHPAFEGTNANGQLERRVLPGLTISLDDENNPSSQIAFSGTSTDAADSADPKLALDAYRPKGHHGTAVAGVIASNETGFLPKAKIISYQVAAGRPFVYRDAEGKTLQYFPVDSVLYASALYNLSAHDGKVHAVNISLGGSAPLCEFEQIGMAALASVRILPIAASGNHFRQGDDPRVLYPARQDGVLSVGAVGIEGKTQFYKLADFSNFDPDNFLVNLVAPGVGVYSAIPTWFNFADDSGWFNGTSLACPFVSAIYAWALSTGQRFEYPQVSQRLEYQKKDQRFDAEHGYGLVKVKKLVEETAIRQKALAAGQSL